MIHWSCSYCREPLEAPDSLGGTSIKCPMCATPCWVPSPMTPAPVPVSSPPVVVVENPAPARRVVGQPICQACGGGMTPARISEGNAVGIAIAIILFCVGCAISFISIGAIFGIPIMIWALFTGGTRRKVWRCVQCRAIILRG